MNAVSVPLPGTESVASRQPGRRPAELPALTGLRFFAAAYVVLYHFWLPFFQPASAAYSIVSAGYTAVGFFFLLSGFVLAYSDGGRTDRRHASRFWLARWSRIYPAYLIAFLLAAPAQIAGSVHVNGASLAWKKLLTGGLLHLALLQAWTPWTAWYWNIPAWSLSAEAFFYLCFPFLIAPVLRLRPAQAWKGVALLFAVELAAPALYCLFRHAAPQPPLPALQLGLEVNPLLRLPEFVIGMLLGHLFGSGWRMNPRVAAWGSVAAICVGAALLAILPLPRPLLASGLLLPVSAFLILALAQNAGPLASLLSQRAIRVGGEASYGIYILQMPVAGLLGVLPGAVIPGSGQGWRLGLFAVVLVIAAIASHFWIETPIRRALGKRFRSGQLAPAVSSEASMTAGGRA